MAVEAANVLLQVYSALDAHSEARGELRELLPEFKTTVEHIRETIIASFSGEPVQGRPGDVLMRTKECFAAIKIELETLIQEHKNSNVFLRTLRTTKHAETVNKWMVRLRALEGQVNLLANNLNGNKGLHERFDGVREGQIDLLANNLDGNMRLHERFDELLETIRQDPASRDDTEISKVVRIIDPTLNESCEKDGDIDVVPVQAKKLLDALAKSGIKNRRKHELSEMARRIWEDWKVDPRDIEFERRKNGDRKRVSAATDIYRAHMDLRDESNDIIMDACIKVAVRQYILSSSQAADQFPLFIREIYLQKQAHHPCVLRTYGGYWPEPDEVEDSDVIEPFLVMEQMSLNLRQAQEKQLLNSLDSQRRILRDVGEGLVHLHSRGIVHRNIKPKNVLLREVDEKIVGRAKVCNFGGSRMAHKTDVVGDGMRTSTGPTSASPYMAPETFSTLPRQVSKTARDIWSFGVLMCVVLVPGFIDPFVDDNPKNMEVASSGQDLAEKVVERANLLLRDHILGDVVIECLSIDPETRPPIEEVLKLIVTDVPSYEFHFMDYVSLKSKEEEVARYIRNRFDAKACTSNISSAVAILEKEALRNSSDVSALNVYAYCRYFGIGVLKNKEEAKSIYQHGCEAEDRTALCSLGAIHFSAGKFDAAVPVLMKAADMGCAAAMLYLAQYEYGVKKDENEAFRRVASAAELGNEEAQAQLASYFRGGIGTKRDEPQAISMLKGLCVSGNAFACMLLAIWHKQGLAVSIGEDRAGELLRIAHERGIDGSCVFNQERNRWVISGE